MLKKIKILGLSAGMVFIISLSFNACSKFSSQIERASLTEDMANLGSTTTVAVADVPPGFPVEFTFNDTVNINLADQRKIMATVTAKAGFTGSLKLAIDRSLLNVLDPAQNIVITPAEVSINLLEGETKSQEFIVTTKSKTKSGMGQFKFLVSPTSVGYSGQIQGDAKIIVNALYQINVSGPANGALMVWSSPAVGTPVDFIANAGGVAIRYVNIDPLVVHRIHASPSKYHGATNMAINGGIYDIKVTETTANFPVTYHCHLHAGADRTLRFNVAP